MARSKKTYTNRLVCLGDSLTQGFQSGAVFNNKLNYPAFLAQAMGIKQFKQANFSAQSGLPFNLEMLLKGIEYEFGPTIEWDEVVGLGNFVVKTIHRIKHYWEVDKNSRFPFSVDDDWQGPFHNQSVFSVTVQDALHLTDAVCKAYIDVSKPKDSFFNIIPYNAFYIASRRVLNPQNSIIGYKNTLVSNVKWFSENGGIENLILFLGANHLVGTITNLTMNFATESDLSRHPFQREATFYSVDLFKKVLDELCAEIIKMNIKNVFTATIPYITQSPLIQEIFHPALHESAFTHHWVNPKDFNPHIHPFLKHSDIVLINSAISDYNDLIKENAKHYNWSVLLMDEIVTNLNPTYRDDLAPSPYPNASIRALKRNPKTKHLVTENGSVLINTNYLELDKETHLVSNGGIFSLDGIHPTTFAYGLIASGFMQLMLEKGVRFEHPLDWDYIIREDTLLTDPPIHLRNLKMVLEFFSSDYKSMFTRLGSNLFAEISSVLGGKN